MSPYRFALAISLVVALTIAAGVVHGTITYRWGPNERIRAAKEKLATLPTEIGDWTMTGEEEMDEDAHAILDPFAFVLRQYTHRRTHISVRVMLLLGRVGPTAVHTPEVCMGTQAYQQEGNTEQVNVLAGEADGEFYRVQFRERTLVARRLEVFYAWCLGDRWSAPKSRFTFVGNPYLYKLQVSGPCMARGKVEEGPCYQFLRAFLPKAREALVSCNGK
jgi:hypothetical protein